MAKDSEQPQPRNNGTMPPAILPAARGRESNRDSDTTESESRIVFRFPAAANGTVRDLGACYGTPEQLKSWKTVLGFNEDN